MSIPSIARQVLPGGCLAIALLTSISAVTLAQPQPVGTVPTALRESVVTGLWLAAGLAVLVPAVPRTRNGIGDSRAAALIAAGILLTVLMVNAVALGHPLAQFPQSYTSLLAAALALGGTTLAALSVTPGGPT